MTLLVIPRASHEGSRCYDPIFMLLGAETAVGVPAVGGSVRRQWTGLQLGTHRQTLQPTSRRDLRAGAERLQVR